jgi:hypothetical protein
VQRHKWCGWTNRCEDWQSDDSVGHVACTDTDLNFVGTKTWRFPEDGDWLPVCHQEVTRALNTETEICATTWRYTNTYSELMFGSPTRWGIDVVKDHPLKLQNYGHIIWYFCQRLSGYWHQQAEPWRRLLTDTVLAETGHVSLKTGWLCRGTGKILGTEIHIDKLRDSRNRYWGLKKAFN